MVRERDETAVEKGQSEVLPQAGGASADARRRLLPDGKDERLLAIIKELRQGVSSEELSQQLFDQLEADHAIKRARKQKKQANHRIARAVGYTAFTLATAAIIGSPFGWGTLGVIFAGSFAVAAVPAFWPFLIAGTAAVGLTGIGLGVVDAFQQRSSAIKKLKSFGKRK